MDEYIIAAQRLVEAQAGVRIMTVDEITSMISSLAASLRAMDSNPAEGSAAVSTEEIDPKVSRKSITDKSITCLCCGKKCKVLNRKHLSSHGLTPAQYKLKFKLPKDTPLTCKELAKSRKEKMNQMRLWERRAKKGAEGEE